MPPNPEDFSSTWQRYRFNFTRYITAIARHSERQAMEQLTARGYPKLAMSFSAPLSILGGRPLRLTELADALGISKQLCLQSLKPIEQAGYIERRADAGDKRAKLVALTATGEQLIADALEEMRAIHSHYESLIGRERIDKLNEGFRTANRVLQAPAGKTYGNIGINLPVSARITPLARSVQERLMQTTAAKGHTLQFSFAQVLSGIDLAGTPVALLAQLNGVTTQAISRIAGELESLGYIRRASGSHDRRSRQLYFTQKGLELIRDSVASVQSLGDELINQVGKKPFLQMESLSRALYDALELEQGILQDFQPEMMANLLGAKPIDEPDTDNLAALLLLASLIDPALVNESKGELALTSAACSARPAARITQLNEQLSANDLASLRRLLNKITAHSSA